SSSCALLSALQSPQPRRVYLCRGAARQPKDPGWRHSFAEALAIACVSVAYRTRTGSGEVMTEKKEMKRRRDDDARDSRPTAMTIARRLGVSKSTISRALKDDPSISATMRRHIQELAREIGYRPNAMARSLVTRRSGVIAFIL